MPAIRTLLLFALMGLLMWSCDTSWEWVAPEGVEEPEPQDPDSLQDSASASVDRFCPDTRDTSEFDSTTAMEALSALLNKQAPPYSGTPYAGDSLRLDSTAGITVLYFWATWCDVSHTIRPIVNKIAEEWSPISGGDSVSFFGVNHEPLPGLKNFARQYPLSFPALHDDSATIHRDFSVRAFPTLVLIKGHTVVGTLALGFTEAQLRSAISAAGQAQPAPADAP